MLVIRLHFRTWALVWAPADACRVLGWRWGFTFGPLSAFRKV